MLNLRQLSDPVDSMIHSDARHFSRFSMPNFKITSNMIGNIGEPLSHGPTDIAEANEADIIVQSRSDTSPSDWETSAEFNECVAWIRIKLFMYF